MGEQEMSEVSIHEVLVWRAFREAGETWMSHREIAAKLDGKVADRTVRAHARKLVSLGMLDVAQVFPAHRYRVSEKADKRNAAYLRRIEHAARVFGV